MIRIRPLTWTEKGSHLHVAQAIGLTYAVFGSPLFYRTTVQGETLYTGTNLAAAKRAAQDRHDELVQGEIVVDETEDTGICEAEAADVRGKSNE